jgi:serine/threonine protein kinase
MDDHQSQALVFISYSSADRVIAEAACHSLELSGLQCWIAPRDVKGAKFYPGQIVQAIRRAKVFVLIFSETANQSDHVLQELERATSIGIPILAVRLGAVIPSDSFSYFLGVRHWVEPPSLAGGTPDFSALPDHVKALLSKKPASPTPSSEQDFEIFGHFRILRREDGSLFRLGQGGMGETFKARDTVLDRTVALKVISAHILSSTSIRERFLREAKAAAKIQHPHVATVFHFGQEGDTYFYAMEFVDGEDLEQYVQTRGRLPVPLALRVAHQVAQGLEAADEQKLIHRDIKPSNIMGSWKKDFNIKLIDFGLAKNLDPCSLQESVLSGRGDFLGTVAYASPEQCKAAVLDVRSDIYSLGVTLWYLLTGERPFSGTPGELIGSHLYKSPPCAQLDGIPEPVIGLLQRMLAKEADARPQTPLALQEEIQKITSELANDFAVSIKPPEPINIAEPELNQTADSIDSVAVDAPGFINYLTLAAGAKLGDEYRLEEAITEGIGGRLFRVSGLGQARANVQLAAKLLHPALAQDPATISLLGSEIDLLLQVHHEPLISYFAFVRETPVPFFVREWVHGFSLMDLLRWKGSLAAAEVVSLLSGIAATLDFGAQRGLGLFEFTLRKCFVVCPETVERTRFREFVSGEPAEFGACRLKLNPLSLGPLLFHHRGIWSDRTLLPDSRVESLTQAAAGIEAAKGVPLLAQMIYELLSGRPYQERGVKDYTPLTAINEAGNRVLRRAILEPATGFANCEGFWQVFTSSLDLYAKKLPSPAPPGAGEFRKAAIEKAEEIKAPAEASKEAPPPLEAVPASFPNGTPAISAPVAEPRGSNGPPKKSVQERPIRANPKAKWRLLWSIGVLAVLTLICLRITLKYYETQRSLTPEPAPKALDVSFPLFNETGYTITAFYISPHGSGKWGENWLRSPLKNGAKTNFKLAPPGAAASWDIRLVYSDGSQQDYNDITNLAETRDLKFEPHHEMESSLQ